MTLVRGIALLALVLLLPLAQAQVVVPAPPSVDSKSFILMDHFSGAVLAELNPDARMDPASLTKMMTSYVVFDELKKGHIKLEDEVTVSEKAWRMPGSRMFVDVNSKVTVDALLHGLVVQSGNDSSVALAEHIAGGESPFASLMNQFAQRLGLSASHFTNASGLPDPELYTTARDMANLASALIRDFPEFYPMHAVREFVHNGIIQHNRNRLLWRDSSVDGLKTGHTEAAGYCLVVSAKREEQRLVVVVLGASSEDARTKDVEGLLNYGFRFFETHKLYAADQPITDVRVWRGDALTVPMGLNSDLYVTVPRGRYRELDAAMEIDVQIVAPVVAGEKRGTVRVKLGDRMLAERELVPLADVPEGDLWRRASDYVRMLFH